jgi:hypothetical protein
MDKLMGKIKKYERRETILEEDEDEFLNENSS